MELKDDRRFDSLSCIGAALLVSGALLFTFGMKQPNIRWESVAFWCDIAVLLTILGGGAVTAVVAYALLAPPAPGHFVIDRYDEVLWMARLLNVALPLGLVGIVGLIIEARRRSEPLGRVKFAMAGYLSVTVVSVAVWSGLAAQYYPDWNLWSQEIWWVP